jgi:hypothetical protein
VRRQTRTENCNQSYRTTAGFSNILHSLQCNAEAYHNIAALITLCEIVPYDRAALRLTNNLPSQEHICMQTGRLMSLRLEIVVVSIVDLPRLGLVPKSLYFN